MTATVGTMTGRLAANPGDAAAVVSLSNALIRLQRVNNDGRAVIAAEEHLRAFLERQPDHYDARRMLAAVLLSEHRFADAIKEANAAMAVDPRDAWNYGAAGDGYMELGDYTRAFETFDRMGRLQPGPSAYARTAYALEIKGDLDGALDYMRKAADGTSPNDAESQAWHFAQVGDLLLKLGRLSQARLEYERADATFPGHPMAVTGLARIRMLDGDLAGARLMLQSQLARTATPDLAMAVGELSLSLGEHAAADQVFPDGRTDRARRLGQRPSPAAGDGAPARGAARPPGGSGRTGEGGRAEPRGHLHHGHAGLGLFQEWPANRRRGGVGAGAAHRHARCAHPVSRRSYFFSCTRRHSSLP